MAEFLSLPYMQKFKCIADKCEDTCCKDWHVRIDKVHYQRMLKWVESNPLQMDIFSKSVSLNTANIASDKSYAYIQMDDNGYCPYLNVQKQCSLHVEKGIEILSDICAFYPRIITERNSILELNGALSCPEVVRLCLSDDINNHVLLKSDSALLSVRDDVPIHRTLSVEDESPIYEKNFGKVQQTFIDIIKLSDCDYFARLYILASYTHSISTIYFDGCKPIDSDVLENYRLHVFEVDYKQSVNHFMAQYENEQPLACIIIYSVLILKLQQAPDENFSKMVVDIFNDLAEQLGYSSYLDIEDAAEYSTLFQSRYQMFSNRVHHQIEDYLTKYLLNCFYREWFITMPSAFIYIQMLLVRTAIIRFLIYNRISPEMKAEKIKSISVEVIYQFARAIDHNMPFLQVVYEALNEQQMLHFDYSTPLIKF